jgi:cytosine/adenosine deaminase-related metal-dependent hydrolase
MATRTLRARWVLPIDRPPMAGGCVTIDQGRIAAVGAVPPARGGAVEDLGDVVLMPGLVNAHTHMEFGDLASPLGQPGMSLPAWIRLVIAERKRTRRDAAAAVATAAGESVAAGVTTIGEISTAPTAAYRTNAVRPVITSFQESIGFSAGRVESALADVAHRLTAAAPPAGLSPHAPYTVHPRLLERLVALAAERCVPVAMHLAESPDELQLLADGSGPFRELLEERSMWDGAAIERGSRPLDYLRRLALAPRALVIHGNYLAADEIEQLGQRRETMSVVYCPRTHAWFDHAPYPLAAMLAAGVRVALGTDSRASNPDLDLVAEMRFAAQRHPHVEPATWLRMITLDAATALGLDEDSGSLTVGKRADLVAIGISVDADRDPAAAVVHGDGAVRGVWLAGQLRRSTFPELS